MTHPGGQWFDEDAGPLVRPYAVTRGRVMGAGHDLDMLTIVVTTTPCPPCGAQNPNTWTSSGCAVSRRRSPRSRPICDFPWRSPRFSSAI